MATLAKTSEKIAVTPGKPGRKRKPFDFTASKQKLRDPGIFTDFVAAYPDHAATAAYFYRLKPKIDVSQIGGDETAIGITRDVSEMNEAYVAEKWGRGLYWICFVDENRQKGLQNVAQGWFDITDPSVKPPVYDVRTLVLSNSDNIDEINRCIALGKLERDEHGRPRVPLTGDKAAAPAAAHVAAAPAAPAAPQSQLMANLGEQVLVKLLDRALPSTALSSPSDQLDQAFKIADRFNRPQNEPLDMEVLADKVAARLKPAAPAPSIDTDMQTYERVGGWLEKIGAGRALDVAALAVPEPSWMKPLITLLEPAAKHLVPLMIARFSGPVAVQVAAPRPLPSGTASDAPQTPQAPPYPVFLPAEAPVMDRAIEVVSLGLQKFELGVSGFDFAAWMVGWYPGGREVFKTLEAAGGPTECIGLMSMIPQLQQVAGPVLADPARKQALEEWLADFLDYNPDAPADESEPEAAAA